MSKLEIIDVHVELHAETDLARLVSDTGDDRDAKWVAKSKTEAWELTKSQSPEQKRRNLIYIISVPEWMAKSNGWI